MTQNVSLDKTLAAEIGGRIRASRKEAGVTVRKIASELGVDPRTVARWQTGESPVSFENLGRIAELVGKRPSYFLEEDAA